GGYLYSLDYARNRPQGRHPGNKDPQSPQLMIVEHADVKRMLMTQKAFVEGAQSLIFYASELIDIQKTITDQQEIHRIELLLEILTPICKSWPSEFCLEANKLAIQVLGGYGYTREFPVERLYRDNRLNHIHEGTWAIHGIDILGRKVRMQGGAALKALHAEVIGTIHTAEQYRELVSHCDQLTDAMQLVENTVAAVGQSEDASLALANATIFLDSMGHVVIAWMWLKQAVAALDGLANGNSADQPFYAGKLAACNFFYRYELPKIKADLDLVASLDATCFDLATEHFIGN
ncbi:MAG: acyl-CoA dehydrogenase, partial [Gammaproteobacteria bacterium]|nr:acyl-CoA dehydrogenase [Gammaproteobacteria bacterium]